MRPFYIIRKDERRTTFLVLSTSKQGFLIVPTKGMKKMEFLRDADIVRDYDFGGLAT